MAKSDSPNAFLIKFLDKIVIHDVKFQDIHEAVNKFKNKYENYDIVPKTNDQFGIEKLPLGLPKLPFWPTKGTTDNDQGNIDFAKYLDILSEHLDRETKRIRMGECGWVALTDNRDKDSIFKKSMGPNSWTPVSLCDTKNRELHIHNLFALSPRSDDFYRLITDLTSPKHCMALKDKLMLTITEYENGENGNDLRNMLEEYKSEITKKNYLVLKFCQTHTDGQGLPSPCHVQFSVPKPHSQTLFIPLCGSIVSKNTQHLLKKHDSIKFHQKL